MKKLLLLAYLVLSFSLNAQVSDILGDWYTVDDATGEVFSVVSIYRGTNGKYYGKIAEVVYPGYEDITCVKCTDTDKDKPMKGLVIIRDMIEKDGYLTGGKVLDPNNGKFYYGRIYLEKGHLKLRGSLDKAGILGRSQLWNRKK